MSGANGWGPNGEEPPYQDPYARPEQYPEQPNPVYDPYTGQYTDPYTGQYLSSSGYPQDPQQQPQQPYPEQPYQQYQQDPYASPYPATPYGGYSAAQNYQGGYPQQPYQTGQFDTGDYGAGQYVGASYPTDPYQTGPYQAGPDDTASYAAQNQLDYHAAYPPGRQEEPWQPGAEQPGSPTQGQDTAGIPRQRASSDAAPAGDTGEQGGVRPASSDGGVPEGQRPGGSSQFESVDDGEQESEDVIDWLKFAETRTERRDERRRKGRTRVVWICVAVLICVAGIGGYLYLGNRGDSDSAAASGGSGKRDVISVHLRELDGRTSNLLLVNNPSSKHGSTVKLPEKMLLSDDATGTVPMGKAIERQGATGTKSSLSTLFDVDVAASWRLDTPFLKKLVDKLGGIDLRADTSVRDNGKNTGKTAKDDKKSGKDGKDKDGKDGKQRGDVVVSKGNNTDLKGTGAVAYATHQAKGESAKTRLTRFARVWNAVLKKMPTESEGATSTVLSLGTVDEPKVLRNTIGPALATLARDAHQGDYSTVTMPVTQAGTLEKGRAGKVVKRVLGGAIKNASAAGSARVSVHNATGTKKAPSKAQAALVNAGYTYVPGGGSKGQPTATSKITYAKKSDRKAAREVASTLGLPKSVVHQGKANQVTDIVVKLGKDYEG